jgi:hypothetical protein
MTHKHIDFDLDQDWTGLTRPVHPRLLTKQEREWINAILQTNREWADVDLGEIFVDAECSCGCHTVHLQRPEHPQNGKTAHVPHETVGMMWIFTEQGKTIGITLHAKYGSLGELEVVYQEGTEPWPPTWREVSRNFL